MNSAQRLPASLTPLDVALAALLRDVGPAEAGVRAHDGPHDDAAGLPELKAWPPHDAAAADGWALRASDLIGASSYTPLPLAKQPVWVEAGDRIPDGCDCVLDEDAVERTGPIAQALAEAIPGHGICRKGGEIVDASRITVAWQFGGNLDVAHRPRLRIVNIPGGTITSKLMLSSLREAGIDTVYAEAVARDPASIARLLDGSQCDLVIIAGGSGVGRTDASVIALAQCGEVIAHGLALQPGRTAAVGRIGRIPVMVVPGAPDQALAVWWTLVGPTIDRLAGRQRQTVTRPLARKIASSVGIAEVILLEEMDNAWAPIAAGDLALAAVARANAWLLVPPGSEGYAAGTAVDAYMLRDEY